MGLEMVERWTERSKGSRCFAQIISKYSKFETNNQIILLPLNNKEIPSFPPHCNYQPSLSKAARDQSATDKEETVEEQEGEVEVASVTKKRKRRLRAQEDER